MSFINKLFNQNRLSELSVRPFSKSLWFFSKIVFFALILTALLYVPTLVSLPKYFDMQLSKFKTLSVESKYDTLAPVYFPERDSLLVVDTTGVHDKLKRETFLITKEGLHFKIFGNEYFIKSEKFNDVLGNRDSFERLFVMLLILILPSIFFWAYFMLWLKYVVEIVLLAGIFFTLFDLTHFRRSWLQVINISAYTAIVPILIETIFLPLNSDLLVSIVEFIGADLYLVPLIVHSVLVVAGVFIVHWVIKSDSDR